VQLGLGLVPIVPILLLPFILIFFVLVFPLWGVALGVLGLLLIIMRAINATAKRVHVGLFSTATAALERSFRWVLTFGGFVRTKKND
jgi:3-hydroxyacyl-[acyl-carrier-protein] dehydratase